MPERNPWAAVLRVLLDAQLIDPNDYGGARVAQVLVEVHRDARADGVDPVQAVADQLDREALGMAGEDAVQDAAREIVALIEGGE